MGSIDIDGLSFNYHLRRVLLIVPIHQIDWIRTQTPAENFCSFLILQCFIITSVVASKWKCAEQKHGYESFFFCARTPPIVSSATFLSHFFLLSRRCRSSLPRPEKKNWHSPEFRLSGGSWPYTLGERWLLKYAGPIVVTFPPPTSTASIATAIYEPTGEVHIRLPIWEESSLFWRTLNSCTFVAAYLCQVTWCCNLRFCRGRQQEPAIADASHWRTAPGLSGNRSPWWRFMSPNGHESPLPWPRQRVIGFN